MATADNIRKKMRQGNLSIGSWLQLPSPDTAEIMAHMGYDWLVIDMEHGSIDVRDLPNLLRAIHGDTLALVRVPQIDTLSIRRTLDAGAQGLIFPMIHNRAELDSAIDSALYPHPTQLTGRRGVGYARANAYGKNFFTYTNETAQDVFLVAQIEHVDALHDLEAIVQHPRLDAILVGPYDLSASMGIMGQFSHKLFIQAMQEISNTCGLHGMPMGTHVIVPSTEALTLAKNEGYAFLAYGTDALFLQQGAMLPPLE